MQHEVTNQCYFSSVMLERLATVTALLRSLHSSTHCTQYCHYDTILCPWSQTCSRPVSSWLLLQIMWPSSSRKYSDSMLLPQSWHLKHSGWYSFSLKWEMQVLFIPSIHLKNTFPAVKYWSVTDLLQASHRNSSFICSEIFPLLLWKYCLPGYDELCLYPFVPSNFNLSSNCFL